MKKFKYIALLLLSIPVWGNAQVTENDETNSDNYNYNTNLYVKYQPKVTDALKMSINPINEKLRTTSPEIKYTIRTKLHPTQRTMSKIPAISIKSPRPEKLSHLYVKAGAGNYANVLAEVDYNNTNVRDHIFAIQARHESGKASLLNSNQTIDNLNIYSKKMFRKSTLDSRVYLKNQGVHFYGYDQDSLSFAKDSIKQNYFNSGFLVSFDNKTDNKARFKYALKGGFDYLTDIDKQHETGVTLNGSLHQLFRENPILFAARYNFYNVGMLNQSYNRNILDIVAKFDYLRDNLRLRAGFDINTENDSNNTKFHFYPDINFEADLLNNNLTFFAGFSGNLEPHTYKSIMETNPYLQTNINLKNTNNKFILLGGLKGSIARKFSYLFKFSYSNTENLLLFENDSSDTKRFITVYDSGNAAIMRLRAEIHTRPRNSMDFFVRAAYNNYDLATQFYAWHLPTTELTFGGKYNLDEKMFFTLDLFVLGERKARVYDDNGNPDVLTLPSIFDVNAGISYKFSDQFSVFFNFNNILANKYSYWNQYELRGFHFLGGIKANLF